MACSTRIRIDEISRFIAFSSAVNSPPFRLLFGLNHLHLRTGKSLKTRVLIQNATRWRRIPCYVSDMLVVDATFIRGCEKHDFAIRIDQDIVFHGMLFLFTTVMSLLSFSVFRTLNRTLRAIMKKNDLTLSHPLRSQQTHQLLRRMPPAMGVRQGLPKQH